ncbi:MAG: hypothetical protein QWI73_06560, partial [Alphaproteobacteria bacterium]|nr:hypothetical protein [Alphaproteobacteria bacterium]
MLEIKKYLTDGTKNFRIDSVQDGSAAFILAELAMQDKLKRPILYITRDNVELDNLAYNLKFTLPAATVLLFPAWDCLPYD